MERGEGECGQRPRVSLLSEEPERPEKQRPLSDLDVGWRAYPAGRGSWCPAATRGFGPLLHQPAKLFTRRSYVGSVSTTARNILLPPLLPTPPGWKRARSGVDTGHEVRGPGRGWRRMGERKGPPFFFFLPGDWAARRRKRFIAARWRASAPFLSLLWKLPVLCSSGAHNAHRPGLRVRSATRGPVSVSFLMPPRGCFLSLHLSVFSF